MIIRSAMADSASDTYVSDTNVSDTNVYVSDIINDIEKCIGILADIEESTVFMFNEPNPESDSERALIWKEAGIRAHCSLYELPILLGRLQGVPRKQQWFVFLHWVLFGEDPV